METTRNGAVSMTTTLTSSKIRFNHNFEVMSRNYYTKIDKNLLLACPNNEFEQCSGTGECYPKEYKCKREDFCKGGTDEYNCGKENVSISFFPSHIHARSAYSPQCNSV